MACDVIKGLTMFCFWEEHMQTCDSMIQNCCRMQGRYIVGGSHITAYLGESNPLHSIPLSWRHFDLGFPATVKPNIPNMFSQHSKPSQSSFEGFVRCPSMTSLETRPRSHSVKITILDTCRSAGILSIEISFCWSNWENWSTSLKEEKNLG